MLAVLSGLCGTGCDAPWVPCPATMRFWRPIEGLTGAQLRSFAHGDQAFGELFSAATGLGPVFNAPSVIAAIPRWQGPPSLNLTRFGRGDASDATI